jgi:hypothetical protein
MKTKPKTLLELLKEYKINVVHDDLYRYIELSNSPDADELEEIHDTIDDNGQVHEYVDGLIDIYYYDLRVWAIHNFHRIQDAMEEGLAGGITDFHELIQCGQYHAYDQEVWEEINEAMTQLIKIFTDNEAEAQGVAETERQFTNYWEGK